MTRARPTLKATFAACLGASVACAAPATAETLKEALAKAYSTNPTLEAARAQLRATDENVVIQRAQGLPNVSTNGQYTEYLKQSSASFIAPERAAAGSVELSVPIYSGGSVRNGIKAAKTRVLAGRADLRGTESSVFSQVVAAYMDVILREALVGLSRNNVDVLQVNLQATSDRFEIGDLTRTDVAQSQSRLAQAESDLRSAQANLVDARERYIQLVGSSASDLQPPPPLPGLPDTADAAVLVALDSNPDMIAAREQAKAAGYDIEVAGAGRLPTLSLFSNGNYTDYLGSLGAVPGGEPAEQVQTSAQAGVRLTLPLFQGGRVAAQERQAQANASAALERVIETERNIIATVRSAYASMLAANAIIVSSQSAVDAANLSLEGVRAENTVGNRTILDILNAQQELLNAQVNLVTARRNAYVAGFTLLAAMGRAEARDLGLEEDIVGPLYDPAANYNRVKGKFWDWSMDPDPTPQSTRTVDIPAPDGEIPPE
ncbi:membrane protein [Altererythrobacter sp. B11]|uniref:TolC family outer membrane protein n=1 Tax=Altererythrobacter sp. B11 TaxID=2060312 RepID=UPI000DC72218|nr:TolC family outer membrane protein [Altererythrobacter sp. B11]BBC71474.1 membrane protein [Altererythrobacter sp. B11]